MGVLLLSMLFFGLFSLDLLPSTCNQLTRDGYKNKFWSFPACLVFMQLSEKVLLINFKGTVKLIVGNQFLTKFLRLAMYLENNFFDLLVASLKKNMSADQ